MTPGALEVTHRTARPLEDPAALHLLFCASADYLRHAGVAAVSAVLSSAPRPIKVHVFATTGDAPAEAKLLATLRPFPQVGLEIYRIRDGRVAGAFTDRYLTQEAYLRFLAPEVLPREVRRVLYLDCDLVVVDDLGPLWEADLGDAAVGAVSDSDWHAGSGETRLTRLGIPRGHPYVNSGVLLMDLDRWREEGLTEAVFRTVADLGPALRFHDQDALNAALHARIAQLDRRWNLQAMMFSPTLRRALPRDWEATREARRTPGIIHWTTQAKPWKLRTWTRRRALYFRFLDRTAWRRDAPPLATRAQRLEWRLARALCGWGLDPYALLPVWARLLRRRRPDQRPSQGAA
jgi:lipopolysaccharide biosynthesis glycosyltransferase